MIAFYQHVYPVLTYRERAEDQRERINRAFRGSGCDYSIVSSQCASEHGTLQRLCWDAHQGGAQYYAYIHLKGLTHPGHHGVDDWRELLEYFHIDCWRRMLERLAEGADAVGLNLQPKPFLHFAGNFFWIKASAVTRLKPIARGDNPEAWIGGESGSLSLASVHDSGVNHYQDRYPAERYR
jgi:hypothetical protein